MLSPRSNKVLGSFLIQHFFPVSGYMDTCVTARLETLLVPRRESVLLVTSANWWTGCPALQLTNVFLSPMYFPDSSWEIGRSNRWTLLFLQLILPESPEYEWIPCICTLKRITAQHGNICHGDVIMADQRWSSVTFSDPSSRQLTGDEPSLGLSGGHAETVTAKIFVWCCEPQGLSLCLANGYGKVTAGWGLDERPGASIVLALQSEKIEKIKIQHSLFIDNGFGETETAAAVCSFLGLHWSTSLFNPVVKQLWL